MTRIDKEVIANGVFELIRLVAYILICIATIKYIAY